jgi:hypothetical protein
LRARFGQLLVASIATAVVDIPQDFRAEIQSAIDIAPRDKHDHRHDDFQQPTPDASISHSSRMTAMLYADSALSDFHGRPTKDFVADLREEAGPQWSSLITDLFDKITVFDDRVTDATSKKRPDGKYDVILKVHTAKVHMDGLGKETRAKFDLPIDIGVFAKAASGRERDEKVLYLAKRNVADGDSTVTVTVDSEPYEAGIDPMNKLVDRDLDDNRKKVDLQ